MGDGDVHAMREEVAVHLFRCGFLSAREAASWLSMTYEGFYELAIRRGGVEIAYDGQAVGRELARIHALRDAGQTT